MWNTSLTLSWKALVSIKSILKCIELILALLVITLTATFKTETTVLCHALNQAENYAIVYKSGFPFDYLDSHHNEDNLSRIEFDEDYGAMAQSYLAWGAITFIYCIVAVFAYVMLNESQEWKYYEQTTKILYVADFIASILWSIMWLAASIAWTHDSGKLKDFIEDHSVCYSSDILLSRDDVNFAQTYVAIAFGYASVIFWVLCIWWTLKSTFIYQLINGSLRTKGGYEPIQ